MRRRDFITMAGAAAATWPGVLRAQAPLRRIGVLVGQGRDAADPIARSILQPFQAALRDAGWVEGRSLEVTYRFGAGEPAANRAGAAELVALHPEVIYAVTTAALDAVYRETHTIPIVFSLVTDPIGPGYVASLAHPGGNVTGFIAQEPSLGGKWVQLLREIAPSTRDVGFLYNPKTAPFAFPFLAAADRGSGRAMTIVNCAVGSDPDIDAAISALARTGRGALVVMAEPFATAHVSHIIAETAGLRLPAVYGGAFADRGGLMSYGYDPAEHFRQPAAYVTRILNGEKPGDLPVQTPTKYDLVINLQTAKALGLDVPTTLLATADQVIE